MRWKIFCQRTGLFLALIVFLQIGCNKSQKIGTSKLALNSAGAATPILLAVLSTGFDSTASSFVPMKISKQAWSFITGNAELADSSGHGTSLVQISAKHCPDCEILPLKTDRLTVANDAGTLWVAIDYALEKGARVILLPYAVTFFSDSLQSVLKKADDKGVLLIAAAGTGLKPFQPVAIESSVGASVTKLGPQSWPSALVVTAAESLQTPDAMTNKGNAIDLLVIQLRNLPVHELSKRSIYFGSEFAAAEIAGRAAELWHKHPELNPSQIRFLFREATGAAPYLYSEKLGYGGGFDAVKLTDASVTDRLKTPLMGRIYLGSHLKRGFAGAPADAVTIDLNASTKIEKIRSVSWICGDGDKVTPILFSEKAQFPWSTQLLFNPSQAEKGRAQIQLQQSPCANFAVQIQADLKGSGTVKLLLSSQL